MECDGNMASLPDGVVHHILSQLNSARKVVACVGVSRGWRDCVPFLPALYFPCGAFNAVGAATDAIGRMVEAAARLEEIVIYCPFSAARLLRWLAMRSATLHVLELWVDSAADKAAAAPGGGSEHLDCIGVVANLDKLRLWGLTMTCAPAWGQLERLRVLEIIGAALWDVTVTNENKRG